LDPQLLIAPHADRLLPSSSYSFRTLFDDPNRALDSPSVARQGDAMLGCLMPDDSPGRPPPPGRAGLAYCAASRLSLLIEQIGRINSTLDGRALLASILDSVRRILQCEASSLFLLDEASGELVLVQPSGPASSSLEGLRVPPGQGICGWVLDQGSSLVIDRPAEDPRFFGDLGEDFVTRSIACVPVRAPEGRVIGVLQALNRSGRAGFDKEDLTLLEALAEQAAIALERERLHRDSLERARLEEQLDLAGEIQDGLWPRDEGRRGGLRVNGACRPAGTIGGDYYDHFTMPDGRLALALGDVCGKGPAAALLMCSLRAALRAHAEHGLPPDRIIERVNRSLLRDTPSGRFATLFFAVLDPGSGELQFVNAGHNPPLLIDTASRSTEELSIGGPLLGAFDALAFQVGSLWLRPGQVLVAYSDGLTEAQDPAGEEYGEERLRDLLLDECERFDGLVERIFAAIDTWTAGAPAGDDLTMLAVRL
jgi:phosphoserine phosphatase RsbU/P